MNFRRAKDNDNYTCRFVSEGGRWELGFIPKTFGRFGLGFSPVDACGPTVEYCCGNNPMTIATVLAAVLAILQRYPEDVNEWTIWQDFPQWEVRPIDKDPCYERLIQMAGEPMKVAV